IDVVLFESGRSEISVNVYPLNVKTSTGTSRHGFWIRDDFGPGTYYVKISTPSDVTNYPVPYTIHAFEDVRYTDYIDECEAKTSQLNDPLISDSLYACQWHLDNPSETDINVEPVWEEGIKGEGVNVAIVDDGMYHAHEDLRDNVDTSRNHDYTGNGDIYIPFKHHGTHVAGLIAAIDNDIGVRGVAPRATIYGYNFLAGERTASNIADAMLRNVGVTAVSNNSWGPREGPGLDGANAFWKRSIENGVRVGYDDKGTLYVFSGGNGHLLGDNSNFDEYVNHYAVAAVCAVNDHDTRSGYSEWGANLWVCAPSNDETDLHQGILTTENSDRYYEEFGGTSSSTPIVAGVAALVRSANPDLTWRDVKLILAGSARKNDPRNTGWQDGARKYGSTLELGRYHFNHEYGFGVVDAKAAVDLAKEWRSPPSLESVPLESST
ncbi:MAG: S8 family serine peptidase, partial [Chloroflexota bacterium]|nr:S8 family serine peptidase [Chloroflexota bacterium]